MKLFSFGVFLLILGCKARPPRKIETPATEKPEETPPETAPLGDMDLEYNRYLQEVVRALESDKAFRKKLETMNASQIRDGTIAKEIDLLHHSVRTKLDEVKAKEMDRLIDLHRELSERGERLDRPKHLDYRKEKFGKDDLELLIKSTTNDLEKADRERRKEFKRYEMEKRFEEEERLKHIANEEARKAEEKRLKEMKEKHKNHEKLNHPLGRDQVEEVWEKQDHMEKRDFEPHTFFAMHDLDGDGFLNEMEIKALLNKELDKAYDKDNKEDDMMERLEELERMREHVLKQSDKDKDRMLSLDEFMELSKGWGAVDEGWNTLDETDSEYTEDEFKEFEDERHKEIQEMLDKGIIPEGYPYFGEMPPGGSEFHLPGPGGPGQPAFVPNPGFQQPVAGQPPVAVPGQPVGQPQGQPQAQNIPIQQQQPPQQQGHAG